jgi:response regulator RpfG family c-di-GMP phosphodiesterase
MTPHASAPKGDDHAEEKILLVDDNPTNLQMLFQLLKKSVGSKLLVAKDGETALVIARVNTHLLRKSVYGDGRSAAASHRRGFRTL